MPARPSASIERNFSGAGAVIGGRRGVPRVRKPRLPSRPPRSCAQPSHDGRRSLAARGTRHRPPVAESHLPVPGSPLPASALGQAAASDALRPESRCRPGERRHKPPRLRLFFALDLPAAVRLGIEAWGRTALVDPALRRVSARNLRITLAYLGERPTGEIAELTAAMRQISEGAMAPSISLRELVPRPTVINPRVF